ncbi:MAG TPA: hypothetical protein VFH47_03350, partial [Candidatus Thermoplasmatota archaeon]|nr:hypothetical protein [Candidatus Thermoplasmatota archaeon]
RRASHHLPQARAALRLWRAWWAAAALVALLEPVRITLYLWGRLPGWLYAATENVVALLACAGLAALLCHLAYLYKGHGRWWPQIAAGYAALALMLLGYLDWIGPPRAILDDGWSLQPLSAKAAPAWAVAAALLLLHGPPLAAAGGYLALLRHAPDRTARYRLMLVAGSILLWFGGTLGAGFLPLRGFSGFAVVQALGILSALLAIAAYDPPGLARRVGIRRAGEERDAAPPVPARP